eukprot:2252883-Lingulodinium_polyedra.AAC.1
MAIASRFSHSAWRLPYGVYAWCAGIVACAAPQRSGALAQFLPRCVKFLIGKRVVLLQHRARR